jgi:hypothetical protein
MGSFRESRIGLCEHETVALQAVGVVGVENPDRLKAELWRGGASSSSFGDQASATRHRPGCRVPPDQHASAALGTLRALGPLEAAHVEAGAFRTLFGVAFEVELEAGLAGEAETDFQLTQTALDLGRFGADADQGLDALALFVLVAPVGGVGFERGLQAMRVGLDEPVSAIDQAPSIASKRVFKDAGAEGQGEAADRTLDSVGFHDFFAVGAGACFFRGGRDGRCGELGPPNPLISYLCAGPSCLLSSTPRFSGVPTGATPVSTVSTVSPRCEKPLKRLERHRNPQTSR